MKAFVRPLAAALACAAVFSTAPVFASVQAPEDAPRAGRGDRLRERRSAARARFLEQLGLTDEQRARIDEIRGANRDAFRAAHQRVAEKRKALDDALLSDPSNQSAIDGRRGDLDAARDEIERLALAARQQIYQVLTPEQREKIRAMRAERRERGKRDRLHRLR